MDPMRSQLLFLTIRCLPLACGRRLHHHCRRLLPSSGPMSSSPCSLFSSSAAAASPGTSQEVLLSRRGCAGVIELNRPKALNALTLPMVRAMYAKLMEWESDPQVALVLIKPAPGSGKAFCAGGDIRAIASALSSGGSADPLPKNFFREEYVLNHAIGTFKKPYVALIDGITMGGGVGVSVHGDYRIATERTMFAMPETNIGFFPDVGAGFFLSRLHAQIGVFLALTGHRLTGEDVKKCGVASHFVNSTDMGELEAALCSGEWMSAKSGTMPRIAELVQQYESRSSLDMRRPFSLNRHMADIERHFRHDKMPQILDSLSSDTSDWAKEQLAILGRMSPTSLRVTLRQLRIGLHLNLANVLRMEYRISQRFMESHDFPEGVRAAIVDRRPPVWKPATVREVTDDQVDAFFAPLAEDRELRLDTKRA